jgi:DNA polymerase
MIEAMGLKRPQVYIANILKCRPPDNRTPGPQEVVCCWGFLLQQMQIIRPRVIVTLGNPAPTSARATIIRKSRGKRRRARFAIGA